MISRTNRHIPVLLLLVFFCLTGCGGGGTPQKDIVNQELRAMLVDGTTDNSFPGVDAYIDTKVPFAGIPMYLDLGSVLDPAVKQLINSNVNNHLDTSSTPAFTAGAGPYSGVVVDAAAKTISVTVSDAEKTTTLLYKFENNKVTRTCSRTYTGGNRAGSKYSSSYVYSTISGNRASAAFTENVEEKISGATILAASYQGNSVYERNPADNSLVNLISSQFAQTRSETNGSNKTSTVSGTVTMGAEAARPGNLSFSGAYSVYLPSYGQVSGNVSASKMTYSRGFNSGDSTYFNSNLTDATSITLTSTSDYGGVQPIANPAWLTGIWSGTFTDSCGADGMLVFSVTNTAMSWYGMTGDGSTEYGAKVSYANDTKIEFLNQSILWGTGAKAIDGRINGNWSSSSCSGSFTLTKN